MNLLVVQRILGMLLVIFSLTMLPPVGVSLYYQDGNAGPFFDAFFALVATGVLIWLPARKKQRDLRLRDGFMVVALFWIVLGFAGALPLILSDKPDLSFTDAVFEAVSGFTTTGATVLVGLDGLPRSILYYRQQIQWLGGIGMVVLAVALLPMLGVGGMQLLKAESPGPVKDAKLKPRITETAKTLWIVYVAITAACAFGYWLAGMTPFDAIAHSFSTVSTGGYSTHDANMKYFNSSGIELVAITFMFVGAVNFSLHFMAWRYARWKDYVRDPEFRVFIAILAAGVIFGTSMLWLTDTAPDASDAFRRAVFQTVSMQTTTGFRTDSFSAWPGAVPVTLMLATFVGGCAGSAAGGMKIMRWMLMWKQGTREVVRLVHPSAELPVKIGNKPVEWRVIDAVWGFFAVYVACFAVLMVSFMGTGEDQVTAFSAIASCINNAGPALGAVHDGFGSLNPTAKWICVVAMLFGRLEIYPLLVLLTPTFWRR